MSDDVDEPRRVRFYGVDDLAAAWQAPRAVEVAAAFDPANVPTNVVDILELHNVKQYLDHGLIPNSYTEGQRDELVALAPQIDSAVARFFAGINSSNIAASLTDVRYEYHRDLIDLLGRSKAFERCDGETALRALKATDVHLDTMLANLSIVRAYGAELREELLASPQGAEYLVRKYLEKDGRRMIHLPRSLTATGARTLLEQYIDGEEANLNYVRLIATARDHPGVGIDAKLRLRAKLRIEALNAQIFERNAGIKTGCEVSIADDQDEPVLVEVDTSEGAVWRYTYGRRWLEETLDNASILNNFHHLFDFADRHALLTLPSYPAALGVMERVIGMTGNAEYKTGAAFQAVNSRSLLQTVMYRQFLKSHDVDLEELFSWFCETYLPEEFGISNFSFNQSAGDTSYLQRVRHLFSEMESMANQFTLFVENGELDRDLLTIGADQVRYKGIPSRLPGKYVYPLESSEIAGILHLLFSDQSTLSYIDETLRGNSTVELLLRRHPAYTDFHDYQKPGLDQLLQLGILEDTGERVRLASLEQLLVLSALFNTQAANYYRLSAAGRGEVDAMVDKGWVTRQSSLLTEAEGDYFNYFLNRVGFSNGPNLRNRYVHGSQPGGENDRAHSEAYIIALRMTVALVIKMNDDLCLWSIANPDPKSSPANRGSVGSPPQ